MTALERVRRGRRSLVVVVLASAALWGAATAMAILSLAALVALVTGMPAAARDAVGPLAAVAAAIAVGSVLWRGRAARSVQRVALWVEEQQPDLQYSLVTAVDAHVASEGTPRDLVAGAERASIETFVRQAGRRSLLRAGAAASVAALAALLVAPLPTVLVAIQPDAGAGIVGAEAPSRFLGLGATITPPKYTRLPSTTVTDPQLIEALVGSSVVFGARGAPAGITMVAGRDTSRVVDDGDRWRVAMLMPREPGMATLRDRKHRRLVVLSPRLDSAPAVRLAQPSQDTVWPEPPRGALVLEARATDDIGLDYGYFEYLISTGSGERFQTVTATGPKVRLGLGTSARLRGSVNLDTMQLAPGTVLSIRAVMLDANDVTGPGRGVSETRTLRVAERPDTVAVTPVPPLPIDSTWLSQRLLNMKTDTLVRGRRRISRSTFVSRSTEYGQAQEAIRQRVLAVIQLLEDDDVGGSFQTETSKLLRQADREMWEARLNLGIAQPDSALPYMRRALKILDDIRTAYRYYLRGIQRPIVVDVEKARLKGTDPAAAAAATSRKRLASASAALAARLEAAALLYPRAPEAALDSLAYVQVSSLSTNPATAQALTRAIAALRDGAPPDSALAGARRTLAPPARLVSGPAEWGAAAP